MRKTYDTITVEFSLFWPFLNFHSCNHLTQAILLIFFLHYIKMWSLQESTCCRPAAFISYFFLKKFLFLCRECLVTLSLDLGGGH